MRRFFAALASFCLCATVHGQQAYWQQQVDYDIRVSLDDREHAIDGFEKISYTNHSPDTLRFIWFHLWPNAYKTDRTAFSDEQLRNGDTRFYFSNKDQKGYINRLDFRVNNVTAETEDHPLYIDVVKLVLPTPLPPGQQINITTPFHVKLPFNFSRGGHEGQSYQLTQWYPKPAVYDNKGWHPLPYLDQGEFYSEYGDYSVSITVPANYAIAATGELQEQSEKDWLQQRATFGWTPVKHTIKNKSGAIHSSVQTMPPSATETKTIRYKQQQVHDFAWFADKRFIVEQDSCRLPSGKVIQVYSYYTAAQKKYWATSLRVIKDAVRFRSALLGDYPYSTLTVVQGPEGFGDGMEYPGITLISPETNPAQLEFTIAHEIGHNWFYSSVGSNERDYPWMDEGLNTYYDFRYGRSRYGTKGELKLGKGRFAIEDLDRILFETKVALHKDQPVSTHSEDLSYTNYPLTAYYKTAAWLHWIEQQIGTVAMDKAMREYVRRWQGKHPQPADFRRSLEESSGRSLDSAFALLDAKGALPSQVRSGTKASFLFSLRSYANYLRSSSKNLWTIAPSIGANAYDRQMLGLFLTNYALPPSPLRFFVAPMYATGSGKLAGGGNINYSFFPAQGPQSIRIGVGGLLFSKNAGMDSFRHKVYERVNRITPSVRINFREAPVSTRQRSLEAKSFLVSETNFDGFAIKSTDRLNYVTNSVKENYFINQLSFIETNYRALYPYRYDLQLQQGKGFYRVNVTGNYFFNYADGGGVDVRLFAAKFGYLGNRTTYQYTTTRFQPKLLGVTGEEDYTYGDYFMGRSASYGNDPDAVVKNRGIGAQQIMIRDGAFKLRLDQYDFLQGRSDNWVAAMNFSSSFPKGILPFNPPLKLFLDIGTNAPAWEKNAATSRFLYVAGLQLSLFKNLLDIYAPVLYSKEFKDNLQSLPEQNTFFKRITFSLNVFNFDIRKMDRSLNF